MLHCWGAENGLMSDHAVLPCSECLQVPVSTFLVSIIQCFVRKRL
uniref:Uncharacterized protein n=1 Tax=Arundo donax TaxID=35708 RepID=A0A0A9CC81_ARUDO